MKKGRSKWYNPGAGRSWLNEGEEKPEAPEVYSEDESARVVEHPSTSVSAEEMEQLSERMRNLGTASDGPAFQMPEQAAPVHFEIPKTNEAAVVVPKVAEPVIHVPSEQSFRPPVQSTVTVTPPTQAEFTPPVKAEAVRPTIPVRATYTPQIPPQPAAPTTQRIAERLAQQRAESQWKPVSKFGHEEQPAVQAQAPVAPVQAPAAPAVETHKAQVVEAQKTPAVEAVVERHAPPVVEKPVVEQAPPQKIVSSPFHPESYFPPRTSAAPEAARPESAAAAGESIWTPRVENKPAVEPTEVETPQKPPVAVPRYASAAASAPFQSAPVAQPLTPVAAHATPIAPAAPVAPPVAARAPIATHAPVSAPPVSAPTVSVPPIQTEAPRMTTPASTPATAPAAHTPTPVSAPTPRQAEEEAPRRSLPARLPGGERPSGFTRTLNAIRAALPIVQQILPMFEGSVAKTLSNLLGPVKSTQQTPAQPPVDLVPVQRGLAEIQKQHRELREQIATQNVSLQRVEDQLSHVATATDRNTREQQELVEEIQAMGKRQSRFSTIVLILLVISIAANVLLYLLMKHIIQ